jgi:hypothetical protein
MTTELAHVRRMGIFVEGAVQHIAAAHGAQIGEAAGRRLGEVAEVRGTVSRQGGSSRCGVRPSRRNASITTPSQPAMSRTSIWSTVSVPLRRR